MLWDFAWFAFRAFLFYRFAKFFVTILRPFLIHFLYPRLGFGPDLTKYWNSWSIVTGCTDGIGKAYTLELAKRGCRRFLLIGRNQDRLDSVSELLTRQYNAETRMLLHDFSSPDYSKIEAVLKGLDEIGILVNNVGRAPELLKRFHEHPPNLSTNIININVVSTVKMCEMILPRMVEQKKGIVVNVSSAIGWRPFPFTSTYCGSKAFISFFTECLQREYKGTGIKIQCLVPMLVATKMTKLSGHNFLIVSAEEYAREAVDVIGARHLAMGCVSHDIQAAFVQLVPFWIGKFLLPPYIRYEERRLRRAAVASSK